MSLIFMFTRKFFTKWKNEIVNQNDLLFFTKNIFFFRYFYPTPVGGKEKGEVFTRIIIMS